MNIEDEHKQYHTVYADILKEYKLQISASVNKKNELKDSFFKVIKGMMICLIVLFFLSVIGTFIILGVMAWKDSPSATVITGALTALISSFGTALLSILKLPQVVADYLFNKDEDVRMGDVIRSIQDYSIQSMKIVKGAAEDATEDKRTAKLDRKDLDTSEVKSSDIEKIKDMGKKKDDESMEQ